jgi:hypothetical protein
MGRTWRARSRVSLVAVALTLSFAPAALAQDGASSPGTIVTATNPGTSARGSDLVFNLTARAERSTVTDPSCRPQDLTIRCRGSLYLRVPELGGMTVTRFEVHRVAVGDIACGDDEGGGCGDEGDGCGDEGEGCEEAALATPITTVPIQAQVNGVAVLTKPGGTGLAAGTQVQVKITLTDNGTAKYGDLVEIQVNLFVPGPVKPLIFETSEPQVIHQTQFFTLGTGG